MRSLYDLEVAGRTGLVRADFNVPLADGPGGPDDTKVITDDGRILAALPTLQYLREHGAKVVGWYDNEWGYSNRLVDLVGLVGSKL